MRTINDIVPPSRRRETETITRNESLRNEPLRLSERPPRFPLKTAAAVIVVITASVFSLFYFSTAKVDVIPATVSAAVQNSFTANQSTGDLPYEIITAQKIASQGVKSTGTKEVNSAASGMITIYNTQSKAQKLIANTRFATTAGLIFRLHEAVTVPAGSTAKPGTVKIKAYADAVGDSFNVGPTSFTVPGFAGTAQASQVYARSTESMSGGASGMLPVVDATTESEARLALSKALETDLLASIKEKVPEGYILLSGSSKTTFQDLALSTSATTGMVDVKEQGTITAVVFPKNALAKAVAASVTGLGYQGEPLTFASANALELTAPQLPEINAPSFTFTLKGTASLVYTVDPTRIAAAVAGKTRSAAEVALTNYPEVKRAVIIIRPFWKQTFPEDPSTITITVSNP